MEIFYLKRILLWHLRGNLSTDVNRNINRILDLLTLASHTDVCWRARFHLSTSSPKNSCVGGYVNSFLFSDRTSRLTTLITFNESQSECIQKNCLLRNQSYLYAFRLKYLVWRKTICRKKKGEIAHTFVWFALSAITARSKSTFESFYPSSCRLNYPKMAG